MSDQKPASPERRRFLDGLLLVAGGAWAAVVGFPVLKFLLPPPEVGGGSELELTDADKLKIQNDKFTIVRLGTDRIIVFQHKDNLLALGAKCTHEGCTVGYKEDEDIIWCACHNGKFSVEGRVISGPPPRPLEAFNVAGDLGGKVTITRAEG